MQHYCDHGTKWSTPKFAYYGTNYLIGHLSLAGKTLSLVRVMLVQLGPLLPQTINWEEVGIPTLR